MRLGWGWGAIKFTKVVASVVAMLLGRKKRLAVRLSLGVHIQVKVSSSVHDALRLKLYKFEGVLFYTF